MNSDPTCPLRVELDAATRKSWMESSEVFPAPRRRWTVWDLIVDRRQRRAARDDPKHLLRTTGMNRLEFWETEAGNLTVATFHPYFFPQDERAARTEWERVLQPLKTQHRITVRAHAAVLSWRFPGTSLLIELWSPA